MINGIHHFEILTKSNHNLLKYFLNGLNFKIIAKNKNKELVQHVVKSKNAHFIISSLNNQIENDCKYDYNHVNDYNTISYLKEKNQNLINKILSKNDSVFNIALNVKSIDNILAKCVKYNIEVIKDIIEINDDRLSNYSIRYAIINSCVDGVVHTLIENVNNHELHRELFLPRFQLIKQTNNEDSNDKNILTTHFDHLTYATYKNTSNSIIEWYRNLFNMQKFYLTNNKNEDFVVKTGESGMKLTAINYWFCAESGIYLDNNESKNDFKFIIAEPLNTNTDNQISIFLNENNGPGVQHIGLYTPNILKSVEMSKVNNGEAKYYVPPETYYDDVDKIKECKQSGHSIDELKRNHILIDVEGDDNRMFVEDKVKNSNGNNESNKKYLLQVFTRPLFERNTFFLEFIQRVNGAFGFGAGNIRALWNAVHLSLVNRKN